tara:strand:+ start:1060 stop:1389 length:330 start_codon:yes stop_codon:yes gene_type:complete
METKKSKINIQSIPEDKQITITIGGIYYQRLNKLLVDYCDSVDQKKLISSLAKIKLDKYLTNDDYAFNLETLIILLKAIELKFNEEGYSIDNEVEIDLPVKEVGEDDIV